MTYTWVWRILIAAVLFLLQTGYPSFAIQAGPDVGMTTAAHALHTPNDWTCIPFERVGPIRADSSEVDLIRLFGQENVLRKRVPGPEGQGWFEVTLVFPDTQNELRIYWKDGLLWQKISYISVRREKAEWHTTDGIKPGTTLAELNRINGQPFSFSGLCWDYGGRPQRDWNGGEMGQRKGLGLILRPAPQMNLPTMFMGERQVRSDEEQLLPDAVVVGTMDIQLSE